MAIDNTVDITLDELKTIIHGLRMSTFSFVEDNAIDEIKAMIKALPLPENIDKLAIVPMAIKHLQRDIGNIMRLIELYGKRDIEFKTRYKSRTGLPPRYKVLGWKHMKSNFTRDLIKTSSVMDEVGYGDISSRLIKCAKATVSNEFSTKDFAIVTADTLDKIGFIKEANEIRKIAQTYDLSMDDVTGGLNQLYQTIDSVIGNLQKKSDQLINIPSAKNVLGLIGNLWHQLTQFKQTIQKPISAIQQASPQISQAMEEALPKSIWDPASKKSLNVEWTAVDAQGEQTAYVTKADGKKYEVQRTSDGKLTTSPTPIQEAMPIQETQPVQPVQPTPQSVSHGVGPGMQTTTLKPKINEKLKYQNQDVIVTNLLGGGKSVQVKDNRGNSFRVPITELQKAAFNLKTYKIASRK